MCESECVSKKKRKKDILTSFKRPKWPIRPNKRERERERALFF